MKYLYMFLIMFLCFLSQISVAQSDDVRKNIDQAKPDVESNNGHNDVKQLATDINMISQTRALHYISQDEYESQGEKEQINKMLVIGKNTCTKELEDLNSKGLLSNLSVAEENRKKELQHMILDFDMQINEQNTSDE
jgi:hypothetical protein